MTYTKLSISRLVMIFNLTTKCLSVGLLHVQKFNIAKNRISIIFVIKTTEACNMLHVPVFWVLWAFGFGHFLRFICWVKIRVSAVANLPDVTLSDEVTWIFHNAQIHDSRHPSEKISLRVWIFRYNNRPHKQSSRGQFSTWCLLYYNSTSSVFAV